MQKELSIQSANTLLTGIQMGGAVSVGLLVLTQIKLNENIAYLPRFSSFFDSSESFN